MRRDKLALLDTLRQRIAHDLSAATASQKDAHSGATHEEAKPENDKDTRALEASYLARGLAKRVHELELAAVQLAAFRPRSFTADEAIALGALVTVTDEADDERSYFLAPAGGGLELDLHGERIAVITSGSPLGRALIGKHLDDELDLRTPRGVRNLHITELS